MKKINKYILWLLPVFGLFACEDEMGVYNSPENRLNFIYEPFTMADTVIPRTFVYDVETRVFDTVWLEVETMGYVEDHERSFALEQVKKGEGEQAVVGKHYIAFDDAEVKDLMVMGTNQVIARIPVIFLRDVSLKTEKRRLEMTIVENDYFKRGIDADCDFMIQTTELAEEPTNWASTWKSYFGEWSSQKMWFIVTYLGLDDFEAEYDAGYKKYLKQKAHSKLNEYNETHDEPLCNDPTKHHENGEQCENCVVFP